MTKKLKEQFETLLDWTRNGGQGRLPETIDLFNRRVGKDLYLRETIPGSWVLEHFSTAEDGKICQHPLHLKHTTLVQLGLTILEANKEHSDRFLAGRVV